ncbi:MAG: hypothetical protein KF784_02130 [Fimbriimonadaceae bacterium]|nr:hypothetical protein [Fimbriimonadaceae bacterium]
MKRAIFLAFVASGIFLAGCRQDNNAPAATTGTGGSVAQTNPDKADPTGATPQTGTGGTTGAVGTTPDAPPDRPIIPNIQKPDKVDAGNPDWVKTSMTPTKLAENVASSLKGIRNTYGKATILVQNKEGNGHCEAMYAIKNSTTYSIDLPELTGLISVGNITSNGSQKQSFHKGRIGRPVSLEQKTWLASIPADKLAERWTTDYAKMMFRGVFDGADAWVEFVRAFSDAKQGYVLKTEQRDLPFRGTIVRNYRFLVSRTEAATKKHGSFEIEVVFDGKMFVPVTFRVDSRDPSNAILFQSSWSSGWDFNQQFEPRQFDLRPSSS